MRAEARLGITPGLGHSNADQRQNDDAHQPLDGRYPGFPGARQAELQDQAQQERVVTNEVYPATIVAPGGVGAQAELRP